MEKKIYFTIPFLEESEKGYRENVLELFLRCESLPKHDFLLKKLPSKSKRTFKLLHKQETVFLSRRSLESVRYFFEVNLSPENEIWELQPFVLETPRAGHLLVIKAQVDKILFLNQDYIFGLDYNLSGFPVKDVHLSCLFDSMRFPIEQVEKVILSEKELY